ncbi:MAG: GlxA family transcriptional regulator, partial [Mesorhizobium sp.]
MQNDRLAGNCFAFYEALMIKSEKPPIFRSERETLKVTFLVF